MIGLVKQIALRALSPRLQHKLRRWYTVNQITHDRHSREPEMALIRAVVRPGDIVADIGANVGIYSKELSLAVGVRGKVWAFEPLQDNYNILIALAAKAHLDNVIPSQLALGAEVTKWDIVIPHMSGFLGMYWAHLARPGDKGRRELVNVSTLDEFFKGQNISRVDFIKCDVEGGELAVLQGGRELVRSLRPAWLMEVSRETSDQVFALFFELGYEAFVYSGRLARVTGYRDREFSNYFFLHPQSTAKARLS